MPYDRDESREDRAVKSELFVSFNSFGEWINRAFVPRLNGDEHRWNIGSTFNYGDILTVEMKDIHESQRQLPSKSCAEEFH